MAVPLLKMFLRVLCAFRSLVFFDISSQLFSMTGTYEIYAITGKQLQPNDHPCC